MSWACQAKATTGRGGKMDFDALELFNLPLCEAWNTRKEGPAEKLQIAILA